MFKAKLPNNDRSRTVEPVEKSITEQQPYGDIKGKGTRKTKATKLREICGRRAPSADFTEQIQ